MNQQQTLALAVRSTVPLLERYLTGFDESNRTTQGPGNPNHVVWTLGHLALVLNRAAEHVEGVPAQDAPPGFVTGQTGSAEAFATESVAYGSTPTDDPDRYPTFARAVEMWRTTCERLASSCEAASDEALARPISWGKGAEQSCAQLVLRLVFHNGTHTGQLIALRKSLGMNKVVG